MRLPRAHHVRLDALGALRHRAGQTVAGTAAPKWTRSVASDGYSNPFRRAPTPLEGEKLPEAKSEPPPSKPWPKPQPKATVPSPPTKPCRPVEKTIQPDPPSIFRRRPTPLPGEVLIDAQPVPPRPKPRAATTPTSSASTTSETTRNIPKQDPGMYRDGVPTPFSEEALIEPRDRVRKKRTPPPPPEPVKATPLSREEAKQLSLRKPQLFEDEVAPMKIPLSTLADQHDQVGDDESQSEAQWSIPTAPDRRSLQEGKTDLVSTIYIDNPIASQIPPVAIRDSLRCIASFSEGPITGNPPVRDLHVPGAPAIFKQRKLPHTLTPASAVMDMRPAFRYESAFMAMRAMTDLSMDDVDVVLTGGFLQKLYSACNDKWFSVDQFVAPNLCTLVRNTLVIHGIVEDDAETQELRAKRGPKNEQRGIMFQDNFTEMSEDTFADTNYYRVLQYRMGDLNCLVMVDTDAVLPKKRDSDSDETPSLDETALSEEIPLDIQPVPRGPNTGPGWRPRLVPGGKFVENRSWTELKVGTGSERAGFSDLVSQCYFSNSLFAVIGTLGWSKFADKRQPSNWKTVFGLHMENLSDRFTAWEQEEQLALRRTVALIHRLRSTAKRLGEGQTLLFHRTHKTQPGENADQRAESAGEAGEGAEESADELAEGEGLPKRSGGVVIKVRTWHSPVRAIPQELIDHFWTTPGNETQRPTRRLVHYYECLGSRT